MINTQNGGPAFTWSSIADTGNFSQGDAPMPIILAVNRDTGTNTTDDANVELNPFEMGSWHQSIAGFAPTRFIGSQFDNGAMNDSAECVRGYDNAGLVMGTSSSLVNQIFTGPPGKSMLPPIISAPITGLLNTASQYASFWEPNPFLNWNTQNNRNVCHFLSLSFPSNAMATIPLPQSMLTLR